MSEKPKWTDYYGNYATLHQAPDMAVLSVPKVSKWEARLFDGYVRFRPQEGHEPNAFHRLMQRLAFGVVWVKTP